MLEEIYRKEEKDGLRFSWNCLPLNRLEYQRLVVPEGVIYTPLNNKSPIRLARGEDIISCRQCRAFINPFVKIAPEQSDVWWCSFCHFANRLSQSQIPSVGLDPECTTLEYILPQKSILPPIFFYVVDTCFEGEDVEDAYSSLKESLITSFSLLPEDALVGLISYGKNVQIHDLSGSEILTNYAFNGNRDYKLEDVQQALGMLSPQMRAHQPQGDGASVLGRGSERFLQPVGIAEYELTKIIEDLPNNVFPHSSMKERPCRATGCALNVASLLLQTILGEMGTTGGHIITIIGGACTYGPGRIVGIELKERIRSHHDIEKTHRHIPNLNMNSSAKVEASLLKDAKKFYEKVTKSLVLMGLSCNIFIGSYDQVGLFEMDEVCYKTGGVVVMSDSFTTSIFKQGFIKFFEKREEEGNEYLDMGFNATLECRTTMNLQIRGLIGNATAIPYRKENRYIEPTISKSSIGEGQTNSWKLCNVNPRSSYAIYFDKVEDKEPYCYAQFLCHYQHPSRQLRLRVTTAQIPVVGPANSYQLRTSFDQEAAIVLMAREAINKLQPYQGTNATAYEVTDVLKLLERSIIDFCARNAGYTKGNVESFTLESDYALLPQFMYYLIRSPFIQVFNNSPDETSYIRHVFMHEDVGDSLIMIQPTLLSYDINTYGSVDEETGETVDEPVPVILDSVSLGPDKILLLDTFFQVLIYHGSRIAEWRRAGYQTMEGYEYFKDFLEAPRREAVEILLDRFPLPRFIDCDEGGSQARFLMARLNPSSNYSGNYNQLLSGQFSILTDDISLQKFIDDVKKAVVNKK